MGNIEAGGATWGIRFGAKANWPKAIGGECHTRS